MRTQSGIINNFSLDAKIRDFGHTEIVCSTYNRVQFFLHFFCCKWVACIFICDNLFPTGCFCNSTFLRDCNLAWIFGSIVFLEGMYSFYFVSGKKAVQISKSFKCSCKLHYVRFCIAPAMRSNSSKKIVNAILIPSTWQKVLVSTILFVNTRTLQLF